MYLSKFISVDNGHVESVVCNTDKFNMHNSFPYLFKNKTYKIWSTKISLDNIIIWIKDENSFMYAIIEYYDTDYNSNHLDKVHFITPAEIRKNKIERLINEDC